MVVVLGSWEGGREGCSSLLSEVKGLEVRGEEGDISFGVFGFLVLVLGF